MAKSALPLLLAGGAAVVLLAGKKKRSSKGSSSSAAPYGEPTPYDPGAKGSPAPAPKPSKPEAKKESDLLEPLAVENLLNSLGYPPGAIDGAYDADTVTAIQTFQMDWNALMEWLYKHNPNINPDTPRYGKISEDGKWGPQTESRAIRAFDTVGSTGDASVELGGESYPVENFRDMVHVSYEVLPA